MGISLTTIRHIMYFFFKVIFALDLMCVLSILIYISRERVLYDAIEAFMLIFSLFVVVDPNDLSRIKYMRGYIDV